MAEAQASTAATYRAMVAAVADGKEPKPEHVERVLIDAGQDVDHLAADVQLLLNRRGWADAVRAADAALAEEETLHAAERAADAVLDEAVKAAGAVYDETIAPIRQRRAELRAVKQRGADARRHLENTATPEIDQQQEDLRARRAAVMQRWQGIAGRANSPKRLEDAAQITEQTADRFANRNRPMAADESCAQAAALHARAESEREQLAAAQAEAAQLDAAIDELERKKLQP